MPTVDPKVFIRLGTHAEKDYLIKTAPFLNGIIIGANLLEGTPGATASLMVKLATLGRKGKPRLEYLIDPMTYAYGCYTNPQIGTSVADLDWIKSEQKGTGPNRGTTFRAFKRSYVKLSESLGNPFVNALSKSCAITPSNFASSIDIKTMCRTVAEYQITRIAKVFEDDPELKDFAIDLMKPSAIFAPYFFIEPINPKFTTTQLLTMGKVTAGLGLNVPVHMMICADVSYLNKQAFLDQLKTELPKTGVRGVWFWFSEFHEDTAQASTLRAFRDLVETLSERVEVYNMHGGYFSLALSKHGLSGVAHGIGYGEQKNVVPVIGKSTPTVRYYLPDLHKRLGVPDIERCFDSLGIITPQDFHTKICDCAVCNGIVSQSINTFSDFGDTHLSSPQSKRLAQTPAAAKRCRFHFLLNRIKERDWLKKASLSDIVAQLEEARGNWAKQPSVSEDCGHIEVWETVLK